MPDQQPLRFESRIDDNVSMELIARAKAGDRSALDALVTRYQDRILRVVRIRLGAKLRTVLESADIVQDVFRIAIEEIGGFEVRSPGSILPWLSKIIEHRIQNQHAFHVARKRDMNRTVAFSGPASSSGSASGFEPVARGQSPSMELRRKEEQMIIDSCIQELPEDEREVILLRKYHEADWTYIREQLGRPTDHAAQQLLDRAMKHLKRKLVVRLRQSDPDA
jgi:RNA polymerase sigma-70 factor (ECF subfamily)